MDLSDWGKLMRSMYERLYKRADEIRSEFKPLDGLKSTSSPRRVGLMSGTPLQEEASVGQENPADLWRSAMRDDK